MNTVLTHTVQKPHARPSGTGSMQHRIRVMMARRKAELHTVRKHKYRMTGCPLGPFDAWLASGWTLHVVIRGECGYFNERGQWIKEN